MFWHTQSASYCRICNHFSASCCLTCSPAYWDNCIQCYNTPSHVYSHFKSQLFHGEIRRQMKRLSLLMKDGNEGYGNECYCQYNMFPPVVLLTLLQHWFVCFPLSTLYAQQYQYTFVQILTGKTGISVVTNVTSLSIECHFCIAVLSRHETVVSTGKKDCSS